MPLGTFTKTVWVVGAEVEQKFLLFRIKILKMTPCLVLTLHPGFGSHWTKKRSLSKRCQRVQTIDIISYTILSRTEIT